MKDAAEGLKRVIARLQPERGGVEFPAPARFRRGAGRENERASVDNAERIIGLLAEELGVPDLSGTRVLDIGCGVRFTQAFYGRNIAVARYHGVELDPALVKFLAARVKDSRFSYRCIGVHHPMYNRKGAPLTPDLDIAAPGEVFDLVTLFSVFTHLAPADFRAMLALARRYVAPHGRMVFTAFVDESIGSDFFDSVPDRPLLRALYRKGAIRSFASAAGWNVRKIFRPPRQQHWIVCTPAPA